MLLSLDLQFYVCTCFLYLLYMSSYRMCILIPQENEESYLESGLLRLILIAYFSTTPQCISIVCIQIVCRGFFGGVKVDSGH